MSCFALTDSHLADVWIPPAEDLDQEEGEHGRKEGADAKDELACFQTNFCILFLTFLGKPN